YHLAQGPYGRNDQDHPDIKREIASARAIRTPARAKLITGIGDNGAKRQQDGRDYGLHYVSGDADASAIHRLIILFHREDPQEGVKGKRRRRAPPPARRLNWKGS